MKKIFLILILIMTSSLFSEITEDDFVDVSNYDFEVRYEKLQADIVRNLKNKDFANKDKIENIKDAWKNFKNDMDENTNKDRIDLLNEFQQKSYKIIEEESKLVNIENKISNKEFEVKDFTGKIEGIDKQINNIELALKGGKATFRNKIENIPIYSVNYGEILFDKKSKDSLKTILQKNIYESTKEKFPSLIKSADLIKNDELVSHWIRQKGSRAILTDKYPADIPKYKGDKEYIWTIYIIESYPLAIMKSFNKSDGIKLLPELDIETEFIYPQEGFLDVSDDLYDKLNKQFDDVVSSLEEDSLFFSITKNPNLKEKLNQLIESINNIPDSLNINKKNYTDKLESLINSIPINQDEIVTNFLNKQQIFAGMADESVQTKKNIKEELKSFLDSQISYAKHYNKKFFTILKENKEMYSKQKKKYNKQKGQLKSTKIELLKNIKNLENEIEKLKIEKRDIERNLSKELYNERITIQNEINTINTQKKQYLNSVKIFYRSDSSLADFYDSIAMNITKSISRIITEQSQQITIYMDEKGIFENYKTISILPTLAKYKINYIQKLKARAATYVIDIGYRFDWDSSNKYTLKKGTEFLDEGLEIIVLDQYNKEKERWVILPYSDLYHYLSEIQKYTNVLLPTANELNTFFNSILKTADNRDEIKKEIMNRSKSNRSFVTDNSSRTLEGYNYDGEKLKRDDIQSGAIVNILLKKK